MRRPTYAVDDAGCWIWQGRLNGSGYGPHRRMYGKLREEVPKGLTIDHLCRVRACCNPDHMEVVTHRENLLRKLPDGCSYGHPWSETNTYIYKGHRMCRPCRAKHARDWRTRRDEVLAWPTG